MTRGLYLGHYCSFGFGIEASSSPRRSVSSCSNKKKPSRKDETGKIKNRCWKSLDGTACARTKASASFVRKTFIFYISYTINTGHRKIDLLYCIQQISHLQNPRKKKRALTASPYIDRHLAQRLDRLIINNRRYCQGKRRVCVFKAFSSLGLCRSREMILDMEHINPAVFIQCPLFPPPRRTYSFFLSTIRSARIRPWAFGSGRISPP